MIGFESDRDPMPEKTISQLDESRIGPKLQSCLTKMRLFTFFFFFFFFYFKNTKKPVYSHSTILCKRIPSSNIPTFIKTPHHSLVDRASPNRGSPMRVTAQAPVPHSVILSLLALRSDVSIIAHAYLISSCLFIHVSSCIIN